MYTIKNILSKSLVPVLVLLFSLASCTKGGEPTPISNNQAVESSDNARFSSVVGGDDNEDDDDNEKGGFHSRNH